MITLEVIAERLDNLIADNAQEHEAILVQTTKTNGSVAELSKWKYIITGALVIMNAVLVPVIVAVLIKFVLNYIG